MLCSYRGWAGCWVKQAPPVCRATMLYDDICNWFRLGEMLAYGDCENTIFRYIKRGILSSFHMFIFFLSFEVLCSLSPLLLFYANEISLISALYYFFLCSKSIRACFTEHISKCLRHTFRETNQLQERPKANCSLMFWGHNLKCITVSRSLLSSRIWSKKSKLFKG